MSFIIFINSQPQPTSMFAISHCFLGCTHWDKYSPSLNWTLDRRGDRKHPAWTRGQEMGF